MKKGTPLCLLFALILVIGPASSLYATWDTESTGDERAALVGRLSHVEGEVSQYVPDEDQWVPAREDAPFGADDILQSGLDGRAELIIPNNTWIRINNDSQVHLITLQPDVTGVAVDAGVVRFLNKGSNAVVRASTPFGSVSAPSGSSFDIYVDDTSVEVVALTGRVSFVDASGRQDYQVIAGSSSLVADQDRVSAGKGIFDPDWEVWNNRRDNVWRMRARRSGESRDYLPPPLSDEAYVLDYYGRWVKVYYDGAYRIFWRPFHVSIRWAPFTRGRWMMWHGDYCWLPDEPFGYLTHHYGNWVLVNNLWYWAPPVVGIRAGFASSSLHIGFAWYPGRVAWVRSGFSIGWVPLAPHEPYYCRHRWGPRVIVVKTIQNKTIIVKKRRYRYARHMVIVPGKNRTWIHRKEKRREHRRAVVAKGYKVSPKDGKERRGPANLKALPSRWAVHSKFASAGPTDGQPIRNRGLRGKRHTVDPKPFRSRYKVKKPLVPARHQQAFRLNEQGHNDKQGLQVPRLQEKRGREKQDRKKMKHHPWRIPPDPEGRSVARQKGHGRQKSPFRFAQRDNKPRLNWRASLLQR